MSRYLTDEAYALSLHQKVVETATSMLNRDINFILGSRILSEICHQMPKMDIDSDFIKFRGIASETDELPLGDVQQLWDKNALEKLKPKILEAEIWARKCGEDACRSLVIRFTKS